MASATYTAVLKYYDGGWRSDETAQGCYSNYRRTGVIYFPNMSLKGKTINSVSLRITSKSAGNNASKTAYFYRSAYQYINTSATGSSHKTGASIGALKGKFYNNTLTLSASFLKSYISAGDKAFCIYANDSLTSSYSTNYLKWSKVVIVVDYSEPVTPVTPTAPTSITPAYGSALTYYDTVKPSISWSGATNAAKYIVERATSSDTHLDTWSVVTNQAGTSFTDSSLNEAYGRYVRYRVKSVSSTNAESGYIYTGNIRRMLPNTAPANVTAAISGENVTVSWTAETASFAVFSVQYSDGGAWTTLGSTAAMSLTVEKSSLTSGSVKFRVRCVQTSVDTAGTITSPYGESNTITIDGGAVYIKVSGTYRKGKVYVKAGGTQKPAKAVYIKSGGTWRKSR